MRAPKRSLKQMAKEIQETGEDIKKTTPKETT